MLKPKLTLHISEMELAICRLPPDAPLPKWIGDDGFVSLTRTADELSIVCAEALVPADLEAERNWRMIMLKGPIDFSLTGILASLVTPLSDAGIPVFAISTYETDYILVKAESFEQAIGILGNTCNIENQMKK